MIPDDKSRERVYGRWAGNPRGIPEDEVRCVKTVPGGAFGIVGQQCARKRGHGPGGEFCKQHAKRFNGAVGNAQERGK